MIKQRHYIPTLFVSMCLISSTLISCTMQTSSHRDKADTLFAEGNYEQSIHEYEHHIQDRLKIIDRPQWENPYLYYLDIGDAYLRLERPDLALATYLEAEERDVEQRFVNDRIRTLARWYIREEDPLRAIALLKKYRERDPLLFDMMLDRISRSLAASGYDPVQETTNTKTPEPLTPGRK